MHWNTDIFRDLHDEIQKANLQINSDYGMSLFSSIEGSFNEIVDDLKSFSAAPPKSEVNRKKLETGVIKLGETEYKVNQDFIREACAVADELSIDEMVAAELALPLVSGEQPKSSSELFLSVLSDFHIRRQYILDLIRFFLDQAWVPSNNPIMVHYKKFVNILSQENPLLKTLELMKDIEKDLNLLEEKEKHGQILGYDLFHQQSIKLQRDFLFRQHDTLGQILVGLVKNKTLNMDGFKLLFEKVHKFSKFDTLFVHYIPCIFAFCRAFDPVLNDLSYNFTISDAVIVYKTLTDASKEWTLSYWRGTVQLIFCTYLTGLCSMDTSALPQELLPDDISQAVRTAIDDGALEFLMSLAADTKPKIVSTRYYDLRPSLQIRVPELHRVFDPLVGISELLLIGLENFVEDFITNLADILREMKMTEEDSQLSEDDKDDSRGVDLERFYILISYIYMDRQDSSLNWFSDQESNLFGFLIWACQSHIEFMSTAFCDMLASLACGPQSSMHVFNFLVEKADKLTKSRKIAACVSWNMILAALQKYDTFLKPKKAAQIITGAKVVMQPSDIPELEHSEMIFLCSYLRLMSEQLKYNDQVRSKVYRLKKQPLSMIIGLQITQTPLLGPSLEVISGFALSPNRKIREHIWERFDEWVFNSVVYLSDGTVLSPHMAGKERLTSIFKTFTDVLGLVNVLQTFLIKRDDSDTTYLPFPSDLGKLYRSPGIYPYVLFVIEEILYSSSSPELTLEDKLALQIPALKFMLQALNLFDERLASVTTSTGINPDNIVHPHNFIAYMQLHPASSVLSCIFDDKIYNLLLSIIAVGIDAIVDLRPSDPLVQSLIYSIKILNRVLDLQEIFLDVICKEARNFTQFQYLSTHGLRNFEDAILYNLPVVTHLALYIGSSNIELATSALELFEKISLSPKFLSPVGSSSDSTIRKNRMLSAIETVDESIRIKEGLIEQLNRSLTEYEEATDDDESLGGIEIKTKILLFLLHTLRLKPNEANLSHFLLGFKIENDTQLVLDDEVGGINSDKSVFQIALTLLIQSVDSVSPVDVTYEPANISSIASQILLELVENPISSQQILDYLRDNDFFLNSLALEPIIEPAVVWNGLKFGKSDEFLKVSKSCQTLSSFLKHRTALLNYFSLEIHTSAENGSLSLLSRYLSTLVNLELSDVGRFAGGSAILLSFLDALEFKVELDSRISEKSLNLFGSDLIRYVTNLMEEESNNPAEVLPYLLNLRGIDLIADRKIQSLDEPKFVEAFSEVQNFFIVARSIKLIRESQLGCLSSWAKLVLIVTIDTNMSPTLRSTFILETFQTIIPKLTAYATTDSAFSSIFASVIVSLLQIYQEDLKTITQGGELSATAGYDRTQSLFQAALAAIQSPISTPELRADLYITCSQYLKAAVESKNSELLNGNVQTLNMAGDRFVKLVCSDALKSEGVSRLVALIFLEAICSACVKANASFFLNSLVRYNMLSLLIESLNRTDDALSNQLDINFESNIFKSVLCVLLQISQTRLGAWQLIQSGLFNTLESSQLLNVDPDLGIRSEVDGDAASAYELLVPVFQLVATVLISMGSENTTIIGRVKEFLKKHNQLVIAILKKDVIQNSGSLKVESDPKLQSLVDLIVLLTTLTNYLS